MKVRKQKIQVKWACNMTLGYNFKIIDDQLLSTSTIQMLNKYLYFKPEEWQGGVPSHSPLYAQCLVHCWAHYRLWQIFSINEWAGLYVLIFLGPVALSSLESFWETESGTPPQNYQIWSAMVLCKRDWPRWGTIWHQIKKLNMYMHCDSAIQWVGI